MQVHVSATYRVIAATVLCLCAPLAAGEPDLYEEYWDYELRSDPFKATESGDYRFNDRVPDVSEQARRARLLQLREFAERVDAAEPRTPADALNAEILRFILAGIVLLVALRMLFGLFFRPDEIFTVTLL